MSSRIGIKKAPNSLGGFEYIPLKMINTALFESPTPAAWP
jgi:hypothetical protein